MDEETLVEEAATTGTEVVRVVVAFFEAETLELVTGYAVTGEAGVVGLVVVRVMTLETVEMVV